MFLRSGRCRDTNLQKKKKVHTLNNTHFDFALYILCTLDILQIDIQYTYRVSQKKVGSQKVCILL